jgi:hypothetical protein
MFDKFKRKNDDKAKRRPPSRLLAVMCLTLLLGAGAAFWLTKLSVPYSQFPAARLFYTSSGRPYAINLQTNERTAAQWPGFAAQPDDSAEIAEVRAQIEIGEYRDFTSSPDNQWWIGWKNISGQWELELMLYDRTAANHLVHWASFMGSLAVCASVGRQITSGSLSAPSHRLPATSEEIHRRRKCGSSIFQQAKPPA